MAFGDSSEATCSVSSLSGGAYSRGESRALSEGNSVASLLDNLRSPVPSELARKRKVSTNPPPVGQKRSKGGSACTVLKSVSPQEMNYNYYDELQLLNYNYFDFY